MNELVEALPLVALAAAAPELSQKRSRIEESRSIAPESIQNQHRTIWNRVRRSPRVSSLGSFRRPPRVPGLLGGTLSDPPGDPRRRPSPWRLPWGSPAGSPGLRLGIPGGICHAIPTRGSTRILFATPSRGPRRVPRIAAVSTEIQPQNHFHHPGIEGYVPLSGAHV